MSAFSGPEISDSGLVLSVDAANPKSYKVNLCNYSSYYAYDGTYGWYNIFPSGASVTSGITDPFGGTGAVRFTCTNTTNALTFNNGGSGAASGTSFNGSTAYTISYNTIGAPSTTGTNATGTWGISISGNAATATSATTASTATSATTATNLAGGSAYSIPYQTSSGKIGRAHV